MSIKNTHTAIPKDVATHDDLDYHYLRRLGIKYIEELGGGLWTDFNSHDPGITMLEMLCYAITDLGTRIDMPINDLLASEGKEGQLADQFYRASDVFPTKSVTEQDYRKLFIDIDGVRNCWLSIAKKTVHVDCKNDVLSYDTADFESLPKSFKREYEFKGLYNVLVDFEGIDESLTKEEKEIEIDRISADIRKKYHENRNLCEDLVGISEIAEQPISVCASIEVLPKADEELIYAKVLKAINEYFSTTLHFYSIKEMLDKGYTSDEIFDGPLLDKGFIDAKELKEAELRSEVRLSDIMKIIMNIEGVKLIKDISIGHCDSSKTLLNEWLICLEENTKPVLCDKSAFSYSKGVLPLNINQTQVVLYLKELEEDAILERVIPEDEKDLDFPESTFRSSGSYTTIQNDFPETYGIGQSGLAARATEKRKSQAKQLKGYLLFFDKILASYFQHLSKTSQLLSVKGKLDKTYFTQAVEGIKDFDELVKDYPNDNDALTNILFEQQDNSIERRNNILDHLMARFAEKFGEYAFLMKTLYGSAANEIVLANKKAFLNDYKVISLERGGAFNYYEQPEENLWDTNNVSGLQKRISRLLGLKNYNRRVLSASFVDIYSLQNAELETVFRWRIKDADKKTILSATEEYKTPSAANKELYFAVLQIIQTPEKEVQNVFKEGILNETIIGNIRVHTSNSGKFSFDVINSKQPKSSKDYIVAKQFKYYNTVAALKKAILDIISFMKFKFTEEGIFLVEHILLRPDVTQDSETPFLPICTDNCENDCDIDPYSYRLSIIIPGYTYRFSNPDFRNYMEMLIKEELPAHVLPKICWVGHRENNLDNIKEQRIQEIENEKNSILKQLADKILAIQNTEPPLEDEADQIAALEAQKAEVEIVFEERKTTYLDSIKDQLNDLVEFEEKYKAYLIAKTTLEQGQPAKLEPLLTAMGNLNTIYPVGRLLDCEDESDELKGKIILGQTNIGTL